MIKYHLEYDELKVICNGCEDEEVYACCCFSSYIEWQAFLERKGCVLYDSTPDPVPFGGGVSMAHYSTGEVVHPPRHCCPKCHEKRYSYSKNRIERNLDVI